MYAIEVEHKYCKCRRIIEGESIAKAFKENNADPNFWIIKDIQHHD